MKRSRTLSALLAVVFAAALLGVAGTAQAAQRNINGWVSQEPCTAGAVCVHYRTWAEGSQTTQTSHHREYTTLKFQFCGCTSGAQGMNQLVRNNAASMNNRSNKIARMYYSPNYGGNQDVLSPGMAGNLYYTANDNASLRVGG
ncbi:peptidase inhibitor family I36 protein [Nocardiopsis alkaliphila]|uniref:peptidase inhibitor family I36 protein n=1 Tax=Nocardiopsis alkaliphila TaxID=225762 RepID=UPI00034BBBE0|nr:peptidase inhibitor family I36 protein [Nocardiopsis alkaliphila]